MLNLRAAMAASAAVFAIAGALAFGNWQTQRAAAKVALEAAWNEAERQEPIVLDAPTTLAEIARRVPQRVRVRGRFAHDQTVWLENRMLDGAAGFHVVTPLVLESGTGAVSVNRGWAPRDPVERTRLPAIGRPAGIVEIEGLALRDLPRLLELGNPARELVLPSIWHNFDLAAMRPLVATPLADFVVQQTSHLDDGLLRRWVRPAFGVDKHRAYAFQWYALAALIIVVAVVVVIRPRFRSSLRTPKP